MERDISRNDARQGNPRKFQWRTFVISTSLAAVLLLGAWVIFAL